MTSPEKIASNRNNARKSTGPRTPAGKARSARNAVTHGLTSRPQTHPGDPPAAFEDSRNEWVGDLNPQGVVQRTLAERACRAAWNLRRCDRYEDATAARRDRDAAERFDLDQAARAEAIGRRLLAVGGAAEGLADECPAALVAELRTTSAGAAWLLGRWAELGRALGESGDWDEPRQLVAIRLLGVRPESAADHPTARKVLPPPIDLGGDGPQRSIFDHPQMRGFLDEVAAAGQRGGCDPKTPWTEASLATALRVRGGATSPSAPAAARLKSLRAMVRSERAKLARLMAKVLRSQAAEDRLGAADRSQFDEARTLSLCLRYATAASRDLHRSIANFLKLRESEDGNETPDSPPPQPGDDEPPRDGRNLQNEQS